MTDEQGYNGWRNYETWAVALWIDNDEGSYGESREIVSSAANRCQEHDADRVRGEAYCEDAPEDDEGRPASDDCEFLVSPAADALKDWIEEGYDRACEMLTENVSGLWSDLLGAAWSEVDWHEIAENFLADEATAEERVET